MLFILLLSAIDFNFFDTLATINSYSFDIYLKFQICFILDEEVSKLETEIEEMKMREKAASMKSKNIVDRLNRRLRDKAEQNKKLKIKIKDLKIELLAETSDRKHVCFDRNELYA